MAREYVEISKNMYLWAIHRAGYKEDEFFRTHPKYLAYIEGEKRPTVRQLEDFAKTVHVPVGYLMLPIPPIETTPIPMFRGKAGSGKFDLNVYQTILDIQGRQEWLSDYIADNELDQCDFIGKYTVTTPIAEMAGIIREYLNLSLDWMLGFSTTDKAINSIVEKMENVGICVFFNGVVGNDTHRPLDVEECRGFALVTDTNAPMIFVNNKDSKTAQMFTLAHEFAHVLVGVSAGYGGLDVEFHDIVESYCDKVAAELLVPGFLLKENWTSIEDCARRFNVSRLVIARRAHNLGIISDEEYRDFYKKYRSLIASQKKKGSGGAFYATALKRVGRLFASHVYSAVKANQISYTEAYRLTGLYGTTFEKFMTTSI